MLTTEGASALKEIGDPSVTACNHLGMLTPGSDYTFVHGGGSKWAKLEGARKTHQGTLDRLTDFCEKDAAEALETQLEKKYGASAVLKQPNTKLAAPAREPASGVQTNKKPQKSVPDGAFLVSVDGAQMVYVLEANFYGDGNIETAARQLAGYAAAAKALFPAADIVKAYSHQGINDKTKAMAKQLGIKTFKRIGNSYTDLE